MTNQILATASQVARSTALRLSVVLCIFAAAGYAWFALELGEGRMDRATASAGQGFSDIFLVMLLGSLLAGTVVVTDFTSKTIHDAVLASPRAIVVSSRTIVFTAVIVLLMLPYGAAVLVALAVGGTYGQLLPTVFNSLLVDAPQLTAGEALRIVVLTLVTGVNYAAQLALCIPAAYVLRRSVAVLAVGFGGSFVLGAVAGAPADDTVLADIAALTPYRTILTADATGGDVLATLAVSLVWIALMTALAWLLFRRADIR